MFGGGGRDPMVMQLEGPELFVVTPFLSIRSWISFHRHLGGHVGYTPNYHHSQLQGEKNHLLELYNFTVFLYGAKFGESRSQNITFAHTHALPPNFFFFLAVHIEDVVFV